MVFTYFLMWNAMEMVSEAFEENPPYATYDRYGWMSTKSCSIQGSITNSATMAMLLQERS